MKLTFGKRIFLYGGIFFLIVYFFGQTFLNKFVNTKLPEIIADKNDTPYNFSYKDVDYSLALRKLTVSGIELTPKESLKQENKTYISGTVKKIVVQGVGFKELFRNHNLIANKIRLVEPDFTVMQSDSVSPPAKKFDLTNSIDISKIFVENAHVKIKAIKDNHLINEVFNFNADILGVHFGMETKNKPIPFTYEKYTMSCDSVYNRLNDLHRLKIGSIQIDPDKFIANKITIRPIRQQIDSLEKDNLLLLNIPKLELLGTDWGYRDNRDFYVEISTIQTDSTSFKVLQKKQKTQKEIKKTAQKVLPPLVPFDLKIGDIKITNFHFNSLDVWNTNRANLWIHNIENKVYDTLRIDKIKLENALVTHTPKEKFNAPKAKLKQIDDRIFIDSLVLKNANYVLKEEKYEKNTLELSNINATIQDININEQTTLEKVPFTYKNTLLQVDKIYYNTQKFYDIHADNLNITDNKLVMKNFAMKPKYSRKKTVSMFRYADDIFNLSASEIALNDYKWGFDKNGVFDFYTKNIHIESIDANIFRDKAPEFNMSIKPMFSKKLRDLKFGMQVDQVTIRRSKLVYEETDEKALAPGKILFTNFSATINNVYSGFNRTKVPRTTIAVDARFMNAAPIRVDWSFNILNRRDQFNIQGVITNFPATAMHQFLQPYAKASTEGTLDIVKFNFNGNNTSATGTFGMEYKDLKVTLYRKDGKAKRRVVSALGNLFIRNNTKGDVKTVNIKKVDRIQEKSFFNYLWLCVMQGLKQTIL